jgi:rubredoxin
MEESSWTELPGLYEEAVLDELCHELHLARVEHESASIPLKEGAEGGPRAGRVRVQRSHVRTAAVVLGRFFELEDPAAARPYKGSCPACEGDVVDSWTCPSCELSFKSGVKENDPLVVFLREHGGFLVDEDLSDEQPAG